jgi:lipopolysaccharide export LptBFGC system permease protein LptF
MKNKDSEFIDVVKEIIRCYFFAFIFVFICLYANQFMLARNVLVENQLTISQKIMLMLYLIPPIIVMGAPFSVCIGFAQGLIKININEKILKNGKAYFVKIIIVSILSLSLIISVLTFVISDYVLPNANEHVTNLYRTALIKNDEKQSGISTEKSPRDMSSKMIIQGIKNIQMEKNNGFEKYLNRWNLELNKKYSIPLGALFLSLFTIALSLIIRNKKIGFCICLFSCILYWALLTYGQIFSIRSGKYGGLAMWLPNILFLCISCVLYLGYKKINKPPASMRAAT